MEVLFDMEYEFDAARWFDFTREESPAESQSAEFWFHSAPSYAPSRECIYLFFIIIISFFAFASVEKTIHFSFAMWYDVITFVCFIICFCSLVSFGYHFFVTKFVCISQLS